MKKPLILIIGKVALIQFLSISSFVSISNLSSCASSTLKIKAPDDSSFVGYVDSIHSGYVTIGKFSYSGSLDDIDNISIINTFKQGFASFEASISDVDSQNKTFFVIVKISNGYPGKIDGSIQFSSKQRKIIFEPKEFSIEIRNRITIKEPLVSLDTSVIIDNKASRLKTYTPNFTSTGIDDFNNLDVSSTFTDETVQFQTIINPIDKNEFNVEILLFNTTKAQDFLGHLIFEYTYGDSKVKLFETKDFKLSVLPERSIIEPKYEKQDVILQHNKGSFTLDGFQFRDIDMPSYLHPVIQFHSEPFPGSFEASIINWNDYFKTFSIQIEFTESTFTNQPVEFSISFNYRESIAYSIETYSAQLYVPIDEDDLAIEVNEESHLVELVGFSETLGNYWNTLMVPDFVESISLCDDAKLVLEKKECHLMLPKQGNLVNISDYCFRPCQGLIGTLFFPSTLLSVGDQPFRLTSFTVLDFTDYDEPPKWFRHTLTLDGIEVPHGTVLVSKDMTIDSWEAMLSIEGLDIRNWDIVQI